MKRLKILQVSGIDFFAITEFTRQVNKNLYVYYAPVIPHNSINCSKYDKAII